MAMRVYKPGQGYWTRMLSAIGFGMVCLATIAWIWRELGPILTEDIRLYVQGGTAVLLVAISGLVLFRLIGSSKKIVDFMIATEAEMKKVNWPSRKVIIGLTWVVIVGTFLLAGLLFVIDIGFSSFFTKIGILKISES